jgi:hypothetical protein
LAKDAGTVRPMARQKKNAESAAFPACGESPGAGTGPVADVIQRAAWGILPVDVLRCE